MRIINLEQSKKKQKVSKLNTFTIDVENGLNLKNKAISSKYFYDDTGSKIFQKITKHPDYYLTRNEIEVLNKIKFKLPTLLKL